MKLRNVLTLAILCGSYLLAGNSQAVEVSAATNTIAAVTKGWFSVPNVKS